MSVVRVTDEAIVVDGNSPLAGASYTCSLSVVSVDRPNLNRVEYQEDDSNDSPFHVATFALGCFWGGELAYLRTKGVVGTKVGYTQGLTINPTYEEVCQGTTRHREAIMVLYDSREVTYHELLEVFLERLRQTAMQQHSDLSSLFQEDDDDGAAAVAALQYSHGIYFHNPEQRRQAEETLASANMTKTVELKAASAFYDAEEYHQQYLLKGGQSAKKGTKETIRCFG